MPELFALGIYLRNNFILNNVFCKSYAIINKFYKWVVFYIFIIKLYSQGCGINEKNFNISISSGVVNF